MLSGAGRLVTVRSASARTARSHDGLRVEAVGDHLGVGFDPLVALALQAGLVGAQLGVQGGAVLEAQACRFAHDEGGPPFGEHAGLQCRQGVGHFVHQGAGEAEVATALVRGREPGKCDLAAQSLAAFGRGYPACGFGGAAGGVQLDGQPRLLGGRSRLRALQFGDS
jgi:hypothetical protein